MEDNLSNEKDVLIRYSGSMLYKFLPLPKEYSIILFLSLFSPASVHRDLQSFLGTLNPPQHFGMQEPDLGLCLNSVTLQI